MGLFAGARGSAEGRAARTNADLHHYQALVRTRKSRRDDKPYVRHAD